jgi:hypothetical protein
LSLVALAVVATVIAVPVCAADDIEIQTVTSGVRHNAPNTYGPMLRQHDDAKSQLTVYGSVEKSGSGAAVSASTTDGHKWVPVVDVSVGTGF